MKKKLLFLSLLCCVVLGACTAKNGPAGEVTPPPSGTEAPATSSTPTAVPTDVPVQTPIVEKEIVVEEVNLFAELYPDRDDGSILSGKEINELAGKLTDGMRCRLTEVTYTFKKSKIAMEVLAGNEDVYTSHTPREESALQLVYNDSEWYNYVLYLPDGYDPQDTETKWPVIYFFHGIGEKGSNLNVLLDYGVLDYIEAGGSIPAIVIAPQCPAESHWADTDVEEPRLKAFIEENNGKYNIDQNRIYATGLSMGGRCTWKQVLAMPDTFAAAVVVCGRTNTYDFSEILDMPIWMFHGAMDDTVAFQNINRIVSELYEQEHRYFKLTVYPYLSHDVWTTTYAKPEVYEWMLSHSLEDRQ